MDNPTVYEIGVHFVPTLGDEGALNAYNDVKKFIIGLGGEEITEGIPERIDLAYTMIKVIDNKNIRFNEAYFCWYKFVLDASSIAQVKEHLTNHASIIRHLLFKTVKENTFIPRRSKRRVRTEEEGDSTDLDALIDAAPVVDEEVIANPATEAPLDAVVEEQPTESEILDNKIESLIPDSE